MITEAHWMIFGFKAFEFFWRYLITSAVIGAVSITLVKSSNPEEETKLFKFFAYSVVVSLGSITLSLLAMIWTY